MHDVNTIYSESLNEFTKEQEDFLNQIDPKRWVAAHKQVSKMMFNILIEAKKEQEKREACFRKRNLPKLLVYR